MSHEHLDHSSSGLDTQMHGSGKQTTRGMTLAFEIQHARTPIEAAPLVDQLIAASRQEREKKTSKV